MTRDLGTREMLRPPGSDPTAIIRHAAVAEFNAGDVVRINGQRFRVNRVVDMTKVGAPDPWVGLVVHALSSEEVG